MDKLPRNYKSSEKKDFEKKIALLNCKRGLISALSVCALLAVYYFLLKKQDNIPYWYNAILIVVFTLQLVSAVILAYIVRNWQRGAGAAYMPYYIASLIMFIPVCIADYKVNSSIVAYVIMEGFAIFVPVLLKAELRIYSVTLLLATIVCAFFAAEDSTRPAVEIYVLGMAGMVAGRYSQERFRSYVRSGKDSRTRNTPLNVDTLTGLASKGGLINTAGVMWQFCIRNHSVAGGIFIDIDFFNNYNDAFGYSQGDECLKEIADAIASCARRDTDTVARVGGEAFFVMVEGVEKENLIALALKIRSAIAGLELEQEFTGVSKYLTVSIGVAYTYPEKGSSFKSLYDSASDAMYTAKENGRNCAVCDGTVYGRMKNGVGTAIGN